MRGRSLFPFRVIFEHLVLFLFYILLFYRSKKKISEKNGSFFSRMRLLLLGMEGGSIYGAMFGVVGRPWAIVSPHSLI